MDYSHTHKNCGGGLANEEGNIRCLKCGTRWASDWWKLLPLEEWEKEFEGYHPEREKINNEEVLVEVQQGKIAFISFRKRGELKPDGTLRSEEGKWRKLQL